MDPISDDKKIQYLGLCSECQTGVMRFQHLTYFTWLNEELITVPDFPAWVCDVCGRREFDSKAVARLNTLLKHEAGRRTRTRRKPGKKGPGRLRPGAPLEKP